MEDWVTAHTSLELEELGSKSVRTVVRSTTDAALLRELERRGALAEGRATWERAVKTIQEILKIAPHNLKIALRSRKQQDQGAREFATDFEEMAEYAGMHADNAKSMLLSALNPKTLAHLQTRLEAAEQADGPFYSTAERLEMVPYQQILQLLKRGPLLDDNLVPANLGDASGKKKAGTAVSGAYTDAFFASAPAAPAHSTPAEASKPTAPSESEATPSAATLHVSAAKRKAPQGQPASVEPLDQHLTVLKVCAAITSSQLPATLAAEPMPLVAAVAKVIADATTNPLLSEGNRKLAQDVAAFLVERLSAVTALAEVKNSGVQLVPRGVDGRREPARTLLFDVARTLAKKMPLMKLVELDQDVRPYLAALMVAAMAKAG